MGQLLTQDEVRAINDRQAQAQRAWQGPGLSVRERTLAASARDVPRLLDELDRLSDLLANCWLWIDSARMTMSSWSEQFTLAGRSLETASYHLGRLLERQQQGEGVEPGRPTGEAAKDVAP